MTSTINTLTLAAILALGTGTALAGVNSISSNGMFSGVPSHAVSCSSGSRYIIYRKGGIWYRGDIGDMGHKFDSWSVDRVASYLCN